MTRSTRGRKNKNGMGFSVPLSIVDIWMFDNGISDALCIEQQFKAIQELYTSWPE